MSTKKTTPPPVIENIKLSELEIEKDFNVRTKESFKHNIAEVKAQIEARGGIDPSIHLIQYVERDGKKIVRGGHTLYESAKALGLKEVPAVKVEMTPLQEQVNLVISNTGHPLTRYEQGTVYVRLRDGQLKDEVIANMVDGQVKDGKEVREVDSKDYEREPMTPPRIAEAVGYTHRHVLDCIIIREQPPEIAELLLDGKISSKGFVVANSGVKKTDVLLRILKAAYAAAKDEGLEKATEKHVRAVKDQFLEKKQVAAPVTTTTETSSTNKDTVKETKTSKGEPPSTAEPEPEPESQLFSDGSEAGADVSSSPSTQSSGDLTPEMRELFDGKTPAGHEDQTRKFITLINDFMDLPDVAVCMNDDEIELLAVAIVKKTLSPI